MESDGLPTAEDWMAPPSENADDALVTRLRTLLVDELDVRIGLDDIDADTPLTAGGADLDSFAIVEFITLIEDTFRIEFAEDDLREETFVNLRSLAAVVAASRSYGESSDGSPHDSSPTDERP